MEGYNIQEILEDAEHYEACMEAMDEHGVPRESDDGMTYSLENRIIRMTERDQNG